MVIKRKGKREREGQVNALSRRLNAEGELNTDVNLAGHLDNLGELNGLLRSALEVLNREDLEAGFIDLQTLALTTDR